MNTVAGFIKKQLFEILFKVVTFFNSAVAGGFYSIIYFKRHTKNDNSSFCTYNQIYVKKLPFLKEH